MPVHPRVFVHGLDGNGTIGLLISLPDILLLLRLAFHAAQGHCLGRRMSDLARSTDSRIIATSPLEWRCLQPFLVSH